MLTAAVASAVGSHTQSRGGDQEGTSPCNGWSARPVRCSLPIAQFWRIETKSQTRTQEHELIVCR